MKKTTYTIRTIADVKKFFTSLRDDHRLNFHADDAFADYVFIGTGDIEESVPFYTKEEAAKLQKVLDKCFAVCESEGRDIHEISLEVFNPDMLDEAPEQTEEIPDHENAREYYGESD